MQESISLSLSQSDSTNEGLTGFAWWIAYLSWPCLLGACILITTVGFNSGYTIPTWLISYFSLFFCLLFLEKRLPFEKRWQDSDGQAWNDVGHTFVCKGTVQMLVLFSSVIGLKDWVKPILWNGHALWPTQMPLGVQVFLGLFIVEFVLYWAHRWAHEMPILWRFHALHHSVLKLWVVNTGRFHFVESCMKVLGLTFVMLLLGMPMLVLFWVSAMTSYIGLLTHCNVEMRTGPLSWIFNTPNIHRWHHSPRLEEGNKNYGENLMVFDHIFSSFFNPPRRPATDIGLNEGHMPVGFWAQLKWPFL